MWNYDEYLKNSLDSPDGALRLEEYFHQEERQPARDFIRLVRTAGGEEVFRLWDARWVGEVQFGADERLRLTLSYAGQHIPLLINVRERTFSHQPHDRAEPLDKLAGRLRKRFVRTEWSAGGKRGWAGVRLLLARLAMFVTCLVFLVAAVWMLLFDSARENNKWWAWAALIFFGICAAASFRELIDLRKG
ncbi:MAG TPA: hypothetical protein VFD58_19635 [Blastocatellia bacterium]|nr:hypothetical protein [Blastocatellia bacterium]